MFLFPSPPPPEGKREPNVTSNSLLTASWLLQHYPGSLNDFSQHSNDRHKDMCSSRHVSRGVGLPTFSLKMDSYVLKVKALCYVLTVLNTVVGTQQALKHPRT